PRLAAGAGRRDLSAPPAAGRGTGLRQLSSPVVLRFRPVPVGFGALGLVSFAAGLLLVACHAQTKLARNPGAELIAEHPPAHRLDLARLPVEKLKRPEEIGTASSRERGWISGAAWP